MEFEKALRYRASVRKYNDKMPDDELIQKIVDAALLSPIVRWHKFHLSVVTNKEAIQMAEDAANEYARTKEPKKFMYGAPVWIILSGERHKDDDPATGKMKNDNLFWNVGSIIENMELEAVSLGLASCGMNATIVAMRDNAKRKYEHFGYKLPDVVFWNVQSRNRQQPVTMNEQGVALVSGCTPRIFSMVASGNIDPYSVMMDVIDSERYEKIVA